MTTVTFTQHHYGDYTRYSPQAFDKQLGKAVQVRNAHTGEITTGTLTAATVSEDGTSVELTIEVPPA